MDNGALPDMMEIDGRLDKHKEPANVDVAAELETSKGVEEPLDASDEGPIIIQPIPELIIAHPIDGQAVDPTISEKPIRQGFRWSRRLSAQATSEVLLVRSREGDVASQEDRCQSCEDAA